MLNTKDLQELKLDDPIMTPNGWGFYQGRWREGKDITHLIVYHTLDCIAPDQTGVAFQPGRSIAVRLYPVELLEL